MEETVKLLLIRNKKIFAWNFYCHSKKKKRTDRFYGGDGQITTMHSHTIYYLIFRLEFWKLLHLLLHFLIFGTQINKFSSHWLPGTFKFWYITLWINESQKNYTHWVMWNLRFIWHILKFKKKSFKNLCWNGTCNWTISPSFCFSWDCRFSKSVAALVCRKLSYNDGLLPFADATIKVFSRISS